MNFYEEVSIVFVTFFSEGLIEKSIKQIDPRIKIFVIENSRSFTLKSFLEKKYKNVKVIIPKKNMGNGAGINLGIKNSRTKYVFYLDVDVKITNKVIKHIYYKAKKINNFSILAPKIKNFNYSKELYIEKLLQQNIYSMNFVTGCALFFNKKNISKIGYFDEKIFLYYEENDFYIRCIKKNKPIFLINDCQIEHIGNSSTNKKYFKEIEINRNWHLMWSNYYFHKKHFGLIKALEKSLFKFLSAILKILFYSIFNNKFKKEVYLARASGIFNAAIKKKSWLRPNINN